MTRAAFLRGALGVGAAFLAGSGFGVGTAAAQPSTGSSGPVDPTQLGDRLIPPWDPRFDAATQLFDPQFDSSIPAAVVHADNESDVQHALGFAAAHGLAVNVRGGGHSYIGASAATGTVVIDTRRINHIRVDGDRLWTGAGASVFAVQSALAESGRTLPLGTCPTVGITGLTLGGGIGIGSRRDGLACDRLESARAVLPDGSVERASATHRPELFWALRGGGGQLGVVTELTWRTCAAETTDGVRIDFAGERAAEVITGWARWLTVADRSQWANIDIEADGAGAVNCTVTLRCPAGDGAAAARLFGSFVAAEEIDTQIHTFTPAELVLEVAGGTADPERTTFTAGSDVLADIGAETANAIVHAVREHSRSGGTGYVLVDPLDGAVTDLAADATAFPWRRHTAVLQWYVPDDSSEEARSWIESAHRHVAPWSYGGYINYIEPDAALERYFAANANRLRAARAMADPTGALYKPSD